MNISEQKTALRQQLKARRNDIPDPLRRQYNQAIYRQVIELPQFGRAKNIFCFIANGTEVDTHQLINHILASGKQLAVPRITDAGTMVAVSLSDWKELTPGQLGILTPFSSPVFTDVIDICITPGLGFTRSGDRLGYGRGYYDKWFMQHDTCKIALAYECQIVEQLPVHDRDIKIDILITEQGAVKIKC